MKKIKLDDGKEIDIALPDHSVKLLSNGGADSAEDGGKDAVSEDPKRSCKKAKN